jgi:hypothetical protein
MLLAAALWRAWGSQVDGGRIENGGRVQIESTPSGARVMVDGSYRGDTPVSLGLESGTHRVEVGSAPAGVDAFDVSIARGQQATYSVVLPEPESARRAELSEAAIAAPSPLPAKPPLPGAQSGRLPAQAQPAATAAAIGWLSVESPVDLVVSRAGRIIGESGSNRIMLPAGTHEVEFANERIRFKSGRTVVIEAGRVQTIWLPVPAGTLSVTAHPWAEVFVDGSAVGATPLGDFSIPAGVHEVVFTHPELGQRRREALIRAGQHVSLAVDLRVP